MSSVHGYSESPDGGWLSTGGSGWWLEVGPQPTRKAGKSLDVVTAYRIWCDGRRWRIALVRQEDLMRLRQKIWKGEVKVPDSEAAGLAAWKEAVSSMRCEPRFVSDGKTAYRFKFRYVADPQTGRLDFQVDGAEPDHLQLSPTDAMPSVNVLPEQMCYPPMGLPSANREVRVDPAPKIGPAHTTLVAVREAGAGRRDAARRYWVDPQHGYAAVRVEVESSAVTQVDGVDEAHNTLLVVEAKRSVPWTKPEDVVVEGSATGAPLGGYSGDVFLAAFADGSVRDLPADMPRGQLRGFATRDGGESLESQRQRSRPGSLNRWRPPGPQISLPFVLFLGKPGFHPVRKRALPATIPVGPQPFAESTGHDGLAANHATARADRLANGSSAAEQRGRCV